MSRLLWISGIAQERHVAVRAAVLGPRGLKAEEEENVQTASETAQLGSVEADTRHSRIPKTPPLRFGWTTGGERSSSMSISPAPQTTQMEV